MILKNGILNKEKPREFIAIALLFTNDFYAFELILEIMGNKYKGMD